MAGNLNKYWPWPAVQMYDFRAKSSTVRDITDMTINRAMTMMAVDFGDDPVDERLYYHMLYELGYTALCEVDGKIYCLYGTPGGWLDRTYQPQIYTVACPNFGGLGKSLERTFEVGKDCVIVWNDSTHRGLLPIISRYATLMAENELSIKRVTILSRMTALYKAPDRRTKEAMDAVIEGLDKGDLKTVLSSDFVGEASAIPLTQTGAATINELIELEQYLKASMYNELGLQANWNGKREAINTAEAGQNEDSLIPLPDDMLRCHRRGLDEANELWGRSFAEDFAGVWATQRELIQEQTEEPGDGDGQIVDDPVIDETVTVEDPARDETPGEEDKRNETDD